jgi:hypothetical protein
MTFTAKTLSNGVKKWKLRTRLCNLVGKKCINKRNTMARAVSRKSAKRSSRRSSAKRSTRKTTKRRSVRRAPMKRMATACSALPVKDCNTMFCHSRKAPGRKTKICVRRSGAAKGKVQEGNAMLQL